MSSRVHDYGDDGTIPYGLWENAVRRALRGKRGQAALRELEAALLALPEKRLIAGRVSDGASVCTLGALALKRRVAGGVSVADALAELADEYPEEEDADWLAAGLGREELRLRYTLAWAVINENDEEYGDRRFSPEERYAAMLAWVRRQLGEVAS